jgi:hypothetical protein
MARAGSFAGAPASYNEKLSIVHPPDNNVDAARYAPELLDPSLKLSEEQREELQEQIDELFSVLRGERDYLP